MPRPVRLSILDEQVEAEDADPEPVTALDHHAVLLPDRLAAPGRCSILFHLLAPGGK
jgi:hypothetical protein